MSEFQNACTIKKALLSGRREKRDERNKRNYDAIREHAEFKLGDAVYTLIQRTPPGMPRKLFDKWAGPWEIVQVSSDKLTYGLQREGQRVQRHINQLMMEPAERSEEPPTNQHLEVIMDIIEPEDSKDGKSPPVEGPGSDSEPKLVLEAKDVREHKPLAPIVLNQLRYFLTQISRGDFMIVQFGKHRYLVQCVAPGAGSIWAQRYASTDNLQDGRERKFSPRYLTHDGLPSSNQPEVLEVLAPQVLLWWKGPLDADKIPASAHADWQAIYPDIPMCE